MFRSLIDSQFRKPSIPLAFLFFLLPTVLSLAFFSFVGLSIDFAKVLLSTGLGLVAWLLSSAVIYLMLLLFKGSDSKASFAGAMSAFSVNFLIIAVVGALVIASVFAAIPGFFEKVASLQGQGASLDEVAAALQPILDSSSQAMLPLSMFLAVVLFAGIFAGIYVIYRIGRLAKETSSFSNAMFAVVSIGLMMFADFVLRLVVQMIF
ncbi:Uncharacterised protein [uncultured archaeon]|nr:Uncharacterised protein [uncultured archaeon]